LSEVWNVIDYSKLPRNKFTCPKCGGAYFGRWEGVVDCHDEFETSCHWSGPEKDCMTASDEEKLELAEETLEKIEAQHALLREILGQDQPWSVIDTLRRLADAAEHLLDVHGCDAHGYEEVSGSVARARDYAQDIEIVLAKTKEKP
jgi:hypothetical protein